VADSPDDPFAQLVREHREIEARVTALERSADAAALDAVAEILAYFDGPAALHNADEHDTLFPQLRPLEGFAQMLGAFEFQHQMNDTAYADLCAAFRAFAPHAPARLRAAAHRFAELQRAHITAEERALFPAAARALSAQAIQSMQHEMTARRAARQPHEL
jgi:hemerythrin-like domain-containing protein